MTCVVSRAFRNRVIFLCRLAVWLAEPLLRMRLMAILVDNCGSLKGGALASALHMHRQHGDPFVHEFIGQLLEKVRSQVPLLLVMETSICTVLVLCPGLCPGRSILLEECL